MSASLGSTSLLVAVLASVCAGQTFSEGANATLECRGSPGGAVSLLRWSKPDLQSDLYVFFFRDDSSVESFQHPLFKGRVKLSDPKLTNGDFSVILTSVSVNDTGRYECYVRYDQQDPRLLNAVTLKVVKSGPGGATEDGGSVGLIVGLSVSAVLLVASIVGFLFYRKQKQNSY